MENVPQVIGKKNRQNFDDWYNKLKHLGYSNFYKILNAKDYGVPQNRERCFMLSILGDYNYIFPQKIQLDKKLKDILEDDIDEKYYLSDRITQFFIKNEEVQKEKGNGFRFNVTDGNVVAKAVTTRAGCRMDDNFIGDKELYIKNNTKKGYQEAKDGDSVNLAYPKTKTRRGRVGSQVSQTLQCNDSMGVCVEDTSMNLKRKLCNKLVEEGRVQEGDGIRHSYTNSRFDSFHIENKDNRDCCAKSPTRRYQLNRHLYKLKKEWYKYKQLRYNNI